MSGKHTPGPWRAVSMWADDADSVVAETSWFCVMVEPSLHDYENKEVDEANARLIAAAPEMLEALKACAQFADGKGMVNGVNILAAIAKAEGEP